MQWDYATKVRRAWPLLLASNVYDCLFCGYWRNAWCLCLVSKRKRKIVHTQSSKTQTFIVILQNDYAKLLFTLPLYISYLSTGGSLFDSRVHSLFNCIFNWPLCHSILIYIFKQHFSFYTVLSNLFINTYMYIFTLHSFIILHVSLILLIFNSKISSQ